MCGTVRTGKLKSQIRLRRIGFKKKKRRLFIFFRFVDMLNGLWVWNCAGFSPCFTIPRYGKLKITKNVRKPLQPACFMTQCYKLAANNNLVSLVENINEVQNCFSFFKDCKLPERQNRIGITSSSRFFHRDVLVSVMAKDGLFTKILVL